MISARFRTKVLLITVLPVITASLILAYIFISGRVGEFNKRINNEGNNIALYLSTMSEYGIFSNNFKYLEPSLIHTINQPNIVAVYIEDQNKSIILKKLNSNYQDFEIKNYSNNIYKVFTSNIIKTSIEIEDVNVLPENKSEINKIIGTVNVVINLKNAKLLKINIIQNGAITTFILTLVTVIIALLFSRSVTNPISQIYNSVNIIKQGNLQHRIPVDFSGELAILAKGINEMTSFLELAQSVEKERNKELTIANLEAERANKAKSLFLSSMSHEIRTPMNAILGFSQLIEIDAKDDLLKENINEIILASKHLIILIDDLLEISQIESGKLILHIESYNLKDIINSCLPMVKSSAEKKSIKIENKIDSLPDIIINVDEKRFKQVVLNLLSNAIKYNKEHGSVILDYSVEDNKILRFSVLDTGKGISAEHYDDVFTYFDRAGQECSNITGSGLGLAISKKLIEKMEGNIGFESAQGEGSHFWIKIPLIVSTTVLK